MKTNFTERLQRLRQHQKKIRLGHLSSLPANYIDELDKETQQGFFSKVINHLKRKLIYIAAFVPLTIVDLFTSIFASVGYKLHGAITQSQTSHKTAGEFWDHAIKNFLAISFSWLGFLWSPKLVSFYFIEDNLNEHQLQSGGKLYEAEVDLQEITPDNPVEQIQSIIANAKGRAITIRGAGFSQGQQFLTDPGSETTAEKPIVLDLHQVKHVELIDKDAKVVKVGAGATWADIQNFANQHQLALKVMQASNVFSVGGSIGTNIHGWDHKSGTVAQTIRAVTVIDPQGQSHTYRKGVDPEFNRVFGSFGLLGVVVEVELELTDNEVLYERSKEVAPAEYLKEFEAIQQDENIRMHLYRLSLEKGKLLQSGVSVNYVKEDDAPPVVTENLTQEKAHGTRFERIGINLMRRNQALQSRYWQYEKNRLLTQSDEQARQTTNEIMQPIINAMFNGSGSEAEWLQEYFVPGDKLEQFLKDLGALLDENEVHMINATVRYVKKDDISLLPYAPEERFAVVLCFNQILKPEEVAQTEKWVRKASQLAIDAGGAPYMPYQSFITKKQYQAAYQAEKVEAFRAVKAEVDPLQTFRSGMHDAYITPVVAEKRDNLFQQLVDNVEAQTAFRGFLENVLCRADADKFFELLMDVTSYCDTYQECYEKMQTRINECMPGTFGDLKNVLRSLSTIKTDLVGQAVELLGDKKQIDGMLEIGYPGRFIPSFAKQYQLTGHRYAMLEGESLTDYIQSGFPRPYEQFFELDYNNPVASLKHYLETAGENSIEVITCFVGLHHFPEEQLDEFLTLVQKALKPGGQFLLVDHNVESEQDMMMAQLAHTVFNVVTGETAENDINERRNFQPMSYWQELLAKHGLGVSTQAQEIEGNAMIRTGDPSRNQMCAFQKAPKPSPLLRVIENQAPADEEVRTEKACCHQQVTSPGQLMTTVGLHKNQIATAEVMSHGEEKQQSLSRQ